MGVKWSAEHRKNYLAFCARRKAAREAGEATPKSRMNGTHQAIIYLKAADRLIQNKPIKEMTEAEVYGHLAYKVLTER